jgi:N-methylhydantoinase A
MRRAYFGRDGLLDTPVFARDELDRGAEFSGPAIVEEHTSTTVLGPGQSARIDEFLNIEISLAQVRQHGS